MNGARIIDGVTLRRLLWVNTLSFLAQVVQISTVPALLALRLSATHHSSLIVGLVAAAPWLAILCFGRFVPRILSALGFVRSNAIALAVSLLAIGVLATASDWRWMLPANFLFGVGLIMRWVSCDTWIVVLAPEAIRGRAIGTHETLMGCGIASGPLLLALVGFTGQLPWLCCAVLLLAAACLLLPMAGVSRQPQVPAASGMRGVARQVPAAVAAGFLAGFAETAAVSFLPVMGDARVLALGAMAALAAFGAGGTLLQVPLGWLADALGYRRAQALVVATLFAGALALLLAAHAAVALFAVLFVFGGVVGGMNTLAVIEAGNRVASESTSTAMLAIAMAYTCGSIAGPLATGATLRVAPQSGFSLVVCAGALLFLPLWLRAARRDGAQSGKAQPVTGSQPVPGWHEVDERSVSVAGSGPAHHLRSV